MNFCMKGGFYRLGCWNNLYDFNIRYSVVSKGIFSFFKTNRFSSRNFSCLVANQRHKSTRNNGFKNTCLSNQRYSSEGNYFTLDQYDCVGFDLDNTIYEYNIDACIKMEYEVISKFLVGKGYDENILLKPLSQLDIDFFQRGLIVDTNKGNLLKVRGDGYIKKASRGTKSIIDEEIVNMYGLERKWKVTSDFVSNPIIAWNGPLSDKMRSFLDYFDTPASLAFSRCVDSLVKSNKEINYFQIWKDTLEGLIDMYDRYHFGSDMGGYFTNIKTNPKLYYKQCTPMVVNWLKELKKHKILFLITGSNADFAAFSAKNCLGENWRDYFHVVICYSRKPGFFIGGRPFVKLNGFKEVDSISDDDINLGGIYNQGNWQGLYRLLSKATGKARPKCLYIGDNLVQDVFTVSEYTDCDTIAVTEELAAEFSSHPAKDFLKSNFWGSYFRFDNGDPSVWGHIIEKYSKICVSNLDVLASKPVNHKFTCFSNINSGYHSVESPLNLSGESVKSKLSL